MVRVQEESVRRQWRLLGRVQGNQLDVCTNTEPVEKTWFQRRLAARHGFGSARAHIEVVVELRPIILRLGLGRVVVPDRGIYRHPVDEVAVRLVESKEPVVVLVTLGANGHAQELLLCIYVVARGYNETH